MMAVFLTVPIWPIFSQPSMQEDSAENAVVLSETAIRPVKCRRESAMKLSAIHLPEIKTTSQTAIFIMYVKATMPMIQSSLQFQVQEKLSAIR